MFYVNDDDVINVVVVVDVIFFLMISSKKDADDDARRAIRRLSHDDNDDDGKHHIIHLIIALVKHDNGRRFLAREAIVWRAMRFLFDDDRLVRSNFVEALHVIMMMGCHHLLMPPLQTENTTAMQLDEDHQGKHGNITVFVVVLRCLTKVNVIDIVDYDEVDIILGGDF